MMDSMCWHIASVLSFGCFIGLVDYFFWSEINFINDNPDKKCIFVRI